MKNSPIVFTFASSEVGLLSQNFIKLIELLTGKLKLKKLYDEYLKENNSPENFWHDAIKKLNIKLVTNGKSSLKIPKKGRLIVVANHAYGVIDGLIMCSLVSHIRHDYKIMTHKVLRQAEAVKNKILPIDFSNSKEAIINNIQSRKDAETILKNNGVLIIFPSGQIATKKKLNINYKADDGEWKHFTSKLAIKTNSSILPIFFEGQNSQLFHIANKIGQTFRYSLMMYELKRKIGDTINIQIGNVIQNKTLKSIGDLKKITKFIRNKTYGLEFNRNDN